jgi:hypothetical protein
MKLTNWIGVPLSISPLNHKHFIISTLNYINYNI